MNIGLKSYEDLFKDEKGRKTEEIVPMDITKLRPYAEQPFKVLLDKNMDELCGSIEQHGILSPIIVRETDDGYEILSGHRRIKACELLGIDEVPMVVKQLDDDAAAILLVDSNLQRENILPSEKAFAYKLKLEALKHQGKRLELTSGQIVQKSKTSVEIVGESVGENYKQVQRYIRLTNLIDPLLDLVDKNEMAMSAGVELSYLGTKHQAEVNKIIEQEDTSPSIAQAAKIRKLAEDSVLNEKTLKEVFTLGNEGKVKIILNEDKLKKYFPKNYTKEQIEDTVMKLIEKWYKKRENNFER